MSTSSLEGSNSFKFCVVVSLFVVLIYRPETQPSNVYICLRYHLSVVLLFHRNDT